MHARVRPRDLLEVAAPRGTFVLQPGDSPVLLISAGVGATPVLAMLHAFAAGRSAREVWWLHGARSRAEEPFAAEARSVLAGLAHGHRHVCYSHPGPGDVLGSDYQTAGHLSAPVLAGLGLPASADAYVCGPAAFMSEVSAALVDLGVDGARVHTEIFGAAPASTPGIAAVSARPPHAPAGPSGDGPEVAFSRSGLTVRWGAGYGSLLERLPLLRDRADVRNGRLLPGSRRRAGRRQRPDLLLPAVRRPGPRPVTVLYPAYSRHGWVPGRAGLMTACRHEGAAHSRGPFRRSA